MKQASTPRRLPKAAESYIDALRTTLRPTTCANYRQALFRFHNWLRAHRYPLRTLSRRQCLRWLQHLADGGLSPATRVNTINPVRAYLLAAEESGLLETPSGYLLRASDLPKLPTYLPRPLQPAVDRELQRRLAASSSPLKRGLLVMRNTGLRIGELCSLTLDCVREDERGIAFLKVPLGKMNNERLVPLDQKTLTVVEELRRGGRSNRKLLLVRPRSDRVQRWQLQQALDEATAGLSAERITTHRLRHTYATTLLNAGMSLVSVMTLLGHRNYRMTLRYAAVTLETVDREYRAALGKLESRYEIVRTPDVPKLAPERLLDDVISWLRTRARRDDTTRHRANVLAKRLRRLRDELEAMAS